jgi:hypothetical protein
LIETSTSQVEKWQAKPTQIEDFEEWKTWISQYIITGESNSSTISHINFSLKHIGKRSVGNPHAAFEEAGTGDVE